MPKIKNKTFYVCVIQHRNWPLRSTILNVHGTNCSADEFYARAHINEPYLCYYVVCRSKLAKADAETCVFTGPVTQAGPRFCDFQKIINLIKFFVSLPGTSTSIKIYQNVFYFVLGKILPSEASANNSYLQVGRPCT